jgi:hypothetical protein
MKCKSLALAVLFAAFASSALAQTQISGTAKCGKPDASQSIEAGDHAGHMLLIEKVSSCTWSVPTEMAGLKSTGFVYAESVDITATKFQTHGYAVITMENGDKAYVRYQGIGSMTKEGTPASSEGTWSYSGGTGKLKGLKGRGAFKTSGTLDAGEAKLEGTYSLPEPKK